MSFITREYTEKKKRLDDMLSENINIPRFKYLAKRSNQEELTAIYKWALEISKNNKNQIFNIRTYDFNPNLEKETTLCPHECDITIDLLPDILLELNSNFFCMVDAEIPDLGRMAGTIIINENENYKRNNKIAEIEYVVKSNRAMVRDINNDKDVKRISLKYFDLLNLLDQDKINIDNIKINKDELIILSSVISTANNFWKQNVIFEWTYFSQPSGIFYNQEIAYPKNHIVFWEYRRPSNSLIRC